MNDKLQTLTDKIYQEGVEKGNREAQEVIETAQKEATSIIAKAKEEALTIIAKAESDAANLKSNSASELKLSSNQALNAVKQEITSIITDSIISPDIKTATTDQEYIKSLLEAVIKEWAAGKETNLQILVPEGTGKGVTEYFNSTAKGVLDKGFTIKEVNGIKSGFQVAPADGSYKVSFTDEEFSNFFKEFVRPQLSQLLFS